jgi:diguanylate cyclase (GGDEF)-like protein/PAS domain S-box-containing protein
VEPEREESLEVLRRENAELRRQLEDFLYHLPDALVEGDLETQRILYMNRMAQVLLGYTAEDLRAGIPGHLIFAEGEAQRARVVVARYVETSLTTASPYTRTGRQDLHEFRMRRKDGTEFPAETQSSFVLDEKGLPRRLRSLIRDVTERRAMEKRLEEMSHRDPLTGCYNRRHLEAQRGELERPTARWAGLVFDLDDFKAINDTYGHEEGDRVLRGFAHFLSRHHRPEDLLVRTGGDEFVLLVRAGSEGEAQAVSRRLIEAAGLDSPAGFSLGMAYRRPGETVESVLARADRTMYATRGRRLRRPKASRDPGARAQGKSPDLPARGRARRGGS